MRPEPNAYSTRWFEFFHIGISGPRTKQETAFACRCAPLPHFRKVLDVCCGMGRHARALSSRSYSVIGVDRDGHMIAKARALAGGPSYVNTDVRDYRPKPREFDVAIIMSQSFGYFDSTTDRKILEQLAAAVREGDRVILDLWNPDFFAAHQGERELQGPRGMARENKRVEGDRLLAKLDYPNGGQDQFEWQLFLPKQIDSMAESVGLRPLLACADFDEARSHLPVIRASNFSSTAATHHRQTNDEGMKTNRSMPSSVVIPVLAYANVREAADWLCGAFGFVERLRIGEHQAQLSFGSGSVIVAGQQEPSPEGGSAHSVMVRVTDVDSHYEHTEKTGARIVSPPTAYPYGERQYSVADIGGHLWTFSQTIADVDPDFWGGILFD